MCEASEFQSVLWDRMADADLLVLIDTPRALSSRWVREELARAQALGLGVLQVVWPAYARTPGTEFCEPRYLDATDFDGPTVGASDTPPLSSTYPTYDWVADNGRANLSSWSKAAAKKAGR